MNLWLSASRIFRRKHYKYLWRKCLDLNIIAKAWLKARKGKSRRAEVRKIESNFRYYVNLIREQIYNTRPGGDPNKAFYPVYHKIKYKLESNKTREICRPNMWEQWFHHIIVLVMEPIFSRHYYMYSCASIPKRGGKYGKNKLVKCIKSGFRYFAKLDIRHFYNHIKIDNVIKFLSLYIEDDWFFFLIYRVFDYYPTRMPLGFYPSHWFSNFLLTQIDWIIYQYNPKCFIRYADDYVICSNNKKKLHKLIKIIRQHLGKIGLRLKRNYQVIKFDYKLTNKKHIGRPIDFMGFLFYRKKQSLRRTILLRTTRMAKRLSKITTISLRQAQSMLSRLGWLRNTNSGEVWKNYIHGKVSIKCLKQIVSKYSKNNQKQYCMPKENIFKIVNEMKGAVI